MSDWLFVLLTLAVGVIVGAVAGYRFGYGAGYDEATLICFEAMRDMEKERNRDD